jgi:RNA polymerase sigma-70 factor, ECF subfamily
MNNDQIVGLLMLIRQEDERAFEQIYLAFSDRVYRYLLRITRDTDIASTLVSDTFMALWGSAGINFRGDSQFSTFLIGIARNKWRNYRRDHSMPVNMEEVDLDNFDVADDRRDTFSWVASRELAQAADICLAKLPDAQRECLYLTMIEGLGRMEIAQLQDVSVNTIKSRMRLGWYGLRKCLSNLAGTEVASIVEIRSLP